MNFEEPMIEFIGITNTDIFVASDGCNCVDLKSGSAETCVGYESFTDSGCEDVAPLID